MRLRHEHFYDDTPSEVFAMLADPAFRREGQRGPGRACPRRSPWTAPAKGSSFTNDQVQRTDGLPSFAKKFAGDDHPRRPAVEEWADETTGSLRIEAPGKPSSIDGHDRAGAEPGPAPREVFELEIKVKVPLIGGKLEGLLEEQVTRGLRRSSTRSARPG